MSMFLKILLLQSVFEAHALLFSWSHNIPKRLQGWSCPNEKFCFEVLWDYRSKPNLVTSVNRHLHLCLGGDPRLDAYTTVYTKYAYH